MHVFSNTGNSSSLGLFVLLLGFVLSILAIVAYFVAIKSFADVAKNKGHNKTGLIWFLGIFATPIVAGLLTAQLPDIANDSAGGGRIVYVQPQYGNDVEKTLEQRRENARRQYEQSDGSPLAKHRYNAQLQYVDKTPRE